MDGPVVGEAGSGRRLSEAMGLRKQSRGCAPALSLLSGQGGDRFGSRGKAL
jgi:hypothetical protein